MKAQPSKLLAEWFWTDRWTGSSGFHLPLHARGLYREMLTQAWRRAAKLPSDPETICRICGVTEKEWLQAWPSVSKFWRLDVDHNLVNDTQLEVYAKAQAAVEVNHERAMKGAYASTQARAQAKHRPDLTQSPPSPSPSPSPISVSVSESVSEKKNNEVISHVGDESPTTGVVFTGGQKERAFDAFWRAYPKKRDRKEAEILWNKIRPDAELRQRMMTALTAQKNSEQWQEEGGRFVPKATKWLEHGDWQKVVSNNGTAHTKIGNDNIRAAQAVMARFSGQ